MKQEKAHDSQIVAMLSDLAIQVAGLEESSQREAVEKEITRARNYIDAGQKEETSEIANHYRSMFVI